MPVWARAPVWSVSVPPFVVQPGAVVPYSTSPLPARLTVAEAIHAAALQNPALQLASAVHVVPAGQARRVALVRAARRRRARVAGARAVAGATTCARRPAAPGRRIGPYRYLRQAPAPSQEPSVPQVGRGLASHSMCGSVPARRPCGSRCGPSWPAAHASQMPAQAVLQQTPSTQKPPRTGRAAMQGLPPPRRDARVRLHE